METIDAQIEPPSSEQAPASKLAILRSALTIEEQKIFQDEGYKMYSKMKKVPSWLGDFRFKAYYNSWRKTPFAPLVDKLSAFVPGQIFNAVFLQVYGPGASVKEHRDPRNNTGHTIIAIAGEFEGAETYVDGQLAGRLAPGDVGILPCTINGVQGPPHRVTEVLSGFRVALILNTIET